MAGVVGVPEQFNASGDVVQPAILVIAPILVVQATYISARCECQILVASIAWTYYHDTGGGYSVDDREVTEDKYVNDLILFCDLVYGIALLSLMMRDTFIKRLGFYMVEILKRSIL